MSETGPEVIVQAGLASASGQVPEIRPDEDEDES